jgi:iron-sulfur cluster repair protein YtfE (RIC family)
MRERHHEPPYPVTAIELLKADHQKVKDLLQQYDAAGQLQRKRQMAQEIFRELELHTQIEEQVFYPVLEVATGQEGQLLIKEALDDHAAVEELIAELRALAPGDLKFPEEFEDLRLHVEHHVREEEARMFPRAQAELVGHLEDLTTEMLRLKQQLAS